MGALASDWLRYFRLLLWNRWTEFKETWQEARSQRLLPSLCFLGWLEKQDGRPSLWLAETFSTSSLKPLNRIQWNLTGSKISTSFTKSVTKSVFFGLIPGRAKIGVGGGLLQESAFLDWKATATNQMYSNDLEACGMKCCYFLFHSEVIFLCVHCSQVSDSGLLGLLFACLFDFEASTLIINLELLQYKIMIETSYLACVLYQWHLLKLEITK